MFDKSSCRSGGVKIHKILLLLSTSAVLPWFWLNGKNFVICHEYWLYNTPTQVDLYLVSFELKLLNKLSKNNIKINWIVITDSWQQWRSSFQWFWPLWWPSPIQQRYLLQLKSILKKRFCIQTAFQTWWTMDTKIKKI